MSLISPDEIKCDIPNLCWIRIWPWAAHEMIREFVKICHFEFYHNECEISSPRIIQNEFVPNRWKVKTYRGWNVLTNGYWAQDFYYVLTEKEIVWMIQRIINSFTNIQWPIIYECAILFDVKSNNVNDGAACKTHFEGFLCIRREDGKIYILSIYEQKIK